MADCRESKVDNLLRKLQVGSSIRVECIEGLASLGFSARHIGLL